MKQSKKSFFDVDEIYKNYKTVQSNFSGINQEINCQRDDFDNSVVTNLVHALDYLNQHIKSESKESALNPHTMLELNAIVHLGFNRDARKEYRGFLKQTHDKFQKYFPDLQAWYKRHEHNHDDPYKIAAGIYVRVLAEPQLFFDGNHRTGSIIANYYLLKKEQNPFVLTTENAVEFFNLASDIKFKKKDMKSNFKRAVGWRDEVHYMRDFLINNSKDFTHKNISKNGKPQRLKPLSIIL